MNSSINCVIFYSLDELKVLRAAKDYPKLQRIFVGEIKDRYKVIF